MMLCTNCHEPILEAGLFGRVDLCLACDVWLANLHRKLVRMGAMPPSPGYPLWRWPMPKSSNLSPPVFLDRMIHVGVLGVAWGFHRTQALFLGAEPMSKQKQPSKPKPARTPIDMPTEFRHVRAYLKILKALEPLDDEQRVRVIQATLVLYGLTP